MTSPNPLASTGDSIQPSAENPLNCGNLAVARCVEVYERAYKARLAKGEHPVFASEHAGKLYRGAMPAPSSREGIRDFIACVTHGILIGAITAKDSKVLLYGAQVAQSALRESKAASSV